MTPTNNGHPPLRICHLGKYYPPASGGMETHVQTLARAQAELGAEVQVICVNHLDRGGQDVTWKVIGGSATAGGEDEQVRLLRLGRRACVARLDVCPGLLPALARLNPENVDVLHLHAPNPTMLLGLAAIRPRVPLVVTHHSDVVRQRFLGQLLRPFEHLVYHRAQRLLTTSPEYLGGSRLLQRYAEHVEPLPLGIDLGPYLKPSPEALSAAQRFRQQHRAPLWLCVGRLIYYKGLQHAVAALRQVPGKLLIIGTGPLEAELQKQAVQAGVNERIVWCGRLTPDELIGAYHAATGLWFPSNARSEGFGLVQVEAMASGCPVINTAIPNSGVAWVSRHEETGLTVPVDDTDAFVAAALRLVQETGLRDRLAAAARERARADFDYRLMGQRSLAIYRRALASTAAAPALAAHPVESVVS